jgi:hypothetical protein
MDTATKVTNINDPVKKLAQKFKSWKLSNEQIVQATTQLQMLLNLYIQSRVDEELSNDQIDALQNEAAKEGLTNEKFIQMVQIAFEEVSGLTIKQEIDRFAQEILEIYEEMEKDLEEGLKYAGTDEKKQEEFLEILTKRKVEILNKDN